MGRRLGEKLYKDSETMLTVIHGKYQRIYGSSVVGLNIGNIEFPEALIDTTLGYFAAIPGRVFDQLENKVALRGVHNVEQTATFIPFSSQVGYADVWVIGTEEGIVPAKLYRNSTVLRLGIERAFVGLPFLNDFDAYEFWANDVCLRVDLQKNLVQIIDYSNKESDKKGFYGLKNQPVIDITDLLSYTQVRRHPYKSIEKAKNR